MRDNVIGTECLSDAAYVLGALTPAERQAYERHLATCDRCQTSVRELAGMPALLAKVGPEALEQPAEAVPATLLPGLLRRGRVQRRRRRWFVAAAAGVAAACIAALVVVLVVRPGATPSVATPSPDQQITLASNSPGAMSVTLALTDKQWGTAITVHCHYQEPSGGWPSGDDLPAYQLIALGKDKKAYPLGSWAAVEGGNSTVNAATALHRADIAQFEVTLPNGQVLLQGDA